MVSPSRRYERSGRSLVRKGRKRTPRDPVLIVCEGEEAEPIYFNAFRSSLRLGPQVVDVRGSGSASDPLSVVRRALDLFDRRAKEGKNPYGTMAAYSRVFCLMDVDDHQTIQPALEAIQRARRGGIPIEAVFSSPSFEIWYYLHFQYSTRHWNASEDLERALDCPSMLSGYEKSRNYFHILGPLTTGAIENSLKLEAFQAEQQRAGIPNPLTHVHRVVQHVLAMLEVEE